LPLTFLYVSKIYIKPSNLKLYGAFVYNSINKISAKCGLESKAGHDFGGAPAVIKSIQTNRIPSRNLLAFKYK